MIKLFLISLFFLFGFSASAQQIDNRLHVIPGLHVGYVFGVTTTWGVDLDITSFDFSLKEIGRVHSGIGFSYNRFKYQRSKYHSYAINILNYSEYSMIKFGISRMKTTWGVDERNKSKSNGFGINAELGLRPGNYYPWISFRIFEETNQCLWLPLRKQYQVSCRGNYDFSFGLPIPQLSRRSH